MDWNILMIGWCAFRYTHRHTHRHKLKQQHTVTNIKKFNPQTQSIIFGDTRIVKMAISHKNCFFLRMFFWSSFKFLQVALFSFFVCGQLFTKQLLLKTNPYLASLRGFVKMDIQLKARYWRLFSGSKIFKHIGIV